MDEQSSAQIGHWRRLVLLLVFAAGVRCWLLVHTTVPARDCVDFVRCAVRLEREPWREVLRTTHQAPVYPFMIFAGAKAARACGVEPDAEGYALISRSISALAGLLTIFPIYFTGRRLFGANAGFLAALLFQVLPVCVRVTTDGLSEGIFFLFATTALELAVAGLQKSSLWRFALSGLVAGVAYLTRPEGLELVVAVGGAAIIGGLSARGVRLPAKALIGLSCGLAPAVSGYVAITGHVTNKPTSVKMFQSEPTPEVGAVSGPPLAAFWGDAERLGSPRAGWAARSVLSESFRAAHYFAFVLAVIGILYYRDRLRREPQFWPLLLLPGLHLLVLWRMATAVGYVSERHAMMVALASCFWVGGLLAALAPRLRFGMVAVVAVILAASLPSTLKPLHANRAGHRAAGEWLAAHAKLCDEIIDPFAWAHFYAGGVLNEGRVTPAPPECRVRYVVVEEGGNRHERLATIAFAREVAARGECLYRSPDSTRVAVYRVLPGR